MELAQFWKRGGSDICRQILATLSALDGPCGRPRVFRRPLREEETERGEQEQEKEQEEEEEEQEQEQEEDDGEPNGCF